MVRSSFANTETQDGTFRLHSERRDFPPSPKDKLIWKRDLFYSRVECGLQFPWNLSVMRGHSIGGFLDRGTLNMADEMKQVRRRVPRSQRRTLSSISRTAAWRVRAFPAPTSDAKTQGDRERGKGRVEILKQRSVLIRWVGKCRRRVIVDRPEIISSNDVAREKVKDFQPKSSVIFSRHCQADLSDLERTGRSHRTEKAISAAIAAETESGAAVTDSSRAEVHRDWKISKQNTRCLMAKYQETRVNKWYM